jgi:hypothetical protein
VVGAAVRYPASPGEGHVKVHFDLLQNDDGFPPANFETMWAVPLDGVRFRLDNIPFFVSGVSCFDIISARRDAAGRLNYDGLLEPGGHSTLRVIFYGSPRDPRPLQERVHELRSTIRDLGCSSEISHISGLISIDVPPEVSLSSVERILDSGQANELWDYEEATLAHADQ